MIAFEVQNGRVVYNGLTYEQLGWREKLTFRGLLKLVMNQIVTEPQRIDPNDAVFSLPLSMVKADSFGKERRFCDV